jgi:hypothetical protein
MRILWITPVLLAGAACAAVPPQPAPAPAAAQAPEEAVFTLQQGSAIQATEAFRRTADRLEVELAAQTGARVLYTAELRADASVARLEVRQFAPGAEAGAEPAQQATGTFRGDSVLLTRTQGGETETDRRATTPGVVAYINPSPSLMEQIVRRARAIGGARVEVPIWVTSGGGQNLSAAVEFTAPDAAVLTLGNTQVQLRVDGEGRVLGGSVVAQALTITRNPPR